MSRITLRDFQELGVKKLRENEEKHGIGSVLAYDMGLGKTLTMASFLVEQRIRENSKFPDLIIVPLCVLTQWKEEILRLDEDLEILIYHGPERAKILKDLYNNNILIPDFVISTYHSLITRELEKYMWNRIVLDEAHIIRNGIETNYKTVPKKAIGAFNISKNAKFCHCITGTPYNNNSNDLLSLMKFIGYDSLDTIKFVEDFVIQKTKEDIIEPINVDTIYVKRPEKELLEDYNYYMCLYIKLMAVLNSRRRAPVELRNIYRQCMMIMTKLRLFCNITNIDSKKKVVIDDEEDEDFVYQDPDEEEIEYYKEVEFSNEEKIEFYNTSEKIKSIYDKILEMLPIVPYNRIIVFSSFVTTLDIFEAIFKDKNKEIITMQYTGKKRKDERDAIVKTFTDPDETSPMILLASLGAGSCGLNLTPCSTVFLADIALNPFDQLQAINRVHRITQKNKVNVYKFCMQSMIEETILKSHDRKISEAKSNGLIIL
jgi:SWI/SNF-related matrix-associated actin-dependent regulator of chromatin subfamily A member 5